MRLRACSSGAYAPIGRSMNAPFGIDARRLRNRSWVAGEVGNRKRTDVPSFMGSTLAGCSLPVKDADDTCAIVGGPREECYLRVAEEGAMAEFPGCLLIVTAEIDPAVEAEWNRWYDTVHLPDALKCPGVRHGRRYVSSGEISETSGGKTERTPRRIYTTI